MPPQDPQGIDWTLEGRVSGVCFDRPLQLSKQLHTHSSAPLAGPKVHRRLFSSRHPEHCLTYRNGSRTPELFILTSTVVRKCYLSAERQKAPPPCFTSNIFLNHLRGKTHRFVRRCRRFMALCPQCGAQAFIHLWAPPLPVPVSTLQSPAAVHTLPQALGTNIGRPLWGAQGH